MSILNIIVNNQPADF